MTSTTFWSPSKWHKRPKSVSRFAKCPICEAPGEVRGEHRAIIDSNAKTRRFAILRACNGRFLETIVDLRDKKSEAASIKRERRKGYTISTANRAHITPKVLRRIIDAGNLLAEGLSMKEIAARLEIPLYHLEDSQTHHPELWKKAHDTAAAIATNVVRGMAGTEAVLKNRGRLLRLATEGAKQKGESLFKAGRDGLTLAGFLEEIYLPSRIALSPHYTDRLRQNVARFTAFTGRELTLNELSEAGLCGFLKALCTSHKGTSVNGYRRQLLTLWRAAYDQGVADRPPRLGLIRRLPEEIDPPQAWTAEDCGRLFSVAAEWPGTVAGLPAGQWWLSLLLTVYWTGCRIGALLTTPAAAYQGKGILVRKQKNHRPQWYSLPPSCCKEIDETRPDSRAMLWPWPKHRRTLFITMRSIIERAGLDCPRTHGQLFHRLRRTTISLCAAVDPAIAQRQAGHANYATTQKHYVDPRIARGLSAADVIPDPWTVERQDSRHLTVV